MSRVLTVAFDLTGTLTRHGSQVSSFMANRAEGASSRILSTGHGLFETARKVKRCFSDAPIISPHLKKTVLDVVSPLRPSTTSVLTTLKDQGARLSLLSNDPKDALGSRVLQYNGLSNLFDDVIFPEDNEGRKKPDPSGLLKVMGQGGSDNVVVMVGDKASDMMTARNAEQASCQPVFCVAIGQESSAADFVRRQQGGGFVLDRLRELPGLMDAMSRSLV